MLNWTKSLGLSTGRCLDNEWLKMIKDAGFEGIDLQYPGDFF